MEVKHSEIFFQKVKLKQFSALEAIGLRVLVFMLMQSDIQSILMPLIFILF
jgi:hypothetical protein